MKTLPAFLTALTLGAAINANAAELPGFEELDVDKDGAISITEAAVHDDLAEAFDRIDTNKDGALSVEEFNTAIGA